jgi:hypothetical protein
VTEIVKTPQPENLEFRGQNRAGETASRSSAGLSQFLVDVTTALSLSKTARTSEQTKDKLKTIADLRHGNIDSELLPLSFTLIRQLRDRQPDSFKPVWSAFRLAYRDCSMQGNCMLLARSIYSDHFYLFCFFDGFSELYMTMRSAHGSNIQLKSEIEKTIRYGSTLSIVS